MDRLKRLSSVTLPARKIVFGQNRTVGLRLVARMLQSADSLQVRLMR